MRRFLFDHLTPALALACALTVFLAAALELPEGPTPAPPAAAHAAR
ncbi:MAG: hypothetical protein ABI520_00255 [Caldimonas sp.]